MYCPSCGRKGTEDPDSSCAKCGLPLGPVARHLEENRAALAERTRGSSEQTYRLLGQALFFAIAAVPLGLAVRNTIQERTDLVGPNRS